MRGTDSASPWRRSIVGQSGKREGRTEFQGAKRVTVRGSRFRHCIERLTAEEIEAEEDGEEGEDAEEFEVVGIQRC